MTDSVEYYVDHAASDFQEGAGIASMRKTSVFRVKKSIADYVASHFDPEARITLEVHRFLEPTPTEVCYFYPYPTPVALGALPAPSPRGHEGALPTLYKVDAKGKERTWRIWVVGATVHKLHGETGGALVPSERTYQAVNEGKSNATTASEQAIRESERDWVKQLGKGYRAKGAEDEALVKRILDAHAQVGGSFATIAPLIRGSSAATRKLEKKITSNEGTQTIAGFHSKILPMKCKKWTFHDACVKYFCGGSLRGKKVVDLKKFFASVQPKLDGVRLLAELYEDQVALTSRNGKQYQWLSHLRVEIARLLEKSPTVILDGEAYAEVMYGRVSYRIDPKTNKKQFTYQPYQEGDPEIDEEAKFNVINGAVRVDRKTPHELEGQICFHIFDVADTTKTQAERFALLDEIFASVDPKSIPHIRRVETVEIRTIEAVREKHDYFAGLGYEGIILRSRDLAYESNKRSGWIRKFKHFVDAEFKIVGVELDPGVDREHFRWVCEVGVTDAKSGQVLRREFSVKPKGPREQKWAWYDSWKDYVGKMLTVRYQSTEDDDEGEGDDVEDEDGTGITIREEGKPFYEVPRFPIGVAIRDYE